MRSLTAAVDDAQVSFVPRALPYALLTRKLDVVQQALHRSADVEADVRRIYHDFQTECRVERAAAAAAVADALAVGAEVQAAYREKFEAANDALSAKKRDRAEKEAKKKAAKSRRRNPLAALLRGEEQEAADQAAIEQMPRIVAGGGVGTTSKFVQQVGHAAGVELTARGVDLEVKPLFDAPGCPRSAPLPGLCLF